MNSYSMKIVLAMLSVLPVSFCFAGGRDGGGGSAVYCNKVEGSQHFPTSNTYFFDYAVGEQSNEKWYVENNNAIAHLKSVVSKMSKEVPFLFNYKKSFENYSTEVVSGWRKISLNPKLKNSDGPDIKLLPSNCIAKTVKQVVTYSSDKYFYDEELFNKLQKTDLQNSSSAQISAMYVHELFRQVDNFESGKTTEIAKFNKILHNNSQMSKEGPDFQSILIAEKLLLYSDAFTNDVMLKYVVDDRYLTSEGIERIKTFFENLLNLRAKELQNDYDESRVVQGDTCSNLSKIVGTAELALKSIMDTDRSLDAIYFVLASEAKSDLGILRSSCNSVAWALYSLENYSRSRGCSSHEKFESIRHEVGSKCEFFP